MYIFTGEYVTRNSIILALLSISFYILIYKLSNLRRKDKKIEKQIYKKISVGFYLGASNIIYLLASLLYYKLFYL